MISYCPKCGKPVADDATFCPECGAPLKASQPAQPAQPGYSKPKEDVGQKPDNNLILAIITTVVCCMPLGVWAIVLASKVDNLWNSGQYAQARENADKAKKISIIGIVAGGVFSVVYLILTFGIYGAAIFADMY